MEKVNLIQFFEHVLGTSEIDNKEDLNTLIEVLEEMGDTKIDTASIEAVREKFIAKKAGTDKAVQE